MYFPIYHSTIIKASKTLKKKKIVNVHEWHLDLRIGYSGVVTYVSGLNFTYLKCNFSVLVLNSKVYVFFDIHKPQTGRFIYYVIKS